MHERLGIDGETCHIQILHALLILFCWVWIRTGQILTAVAQVIDLKTIKTTHTGLCSHVYSFHFNTHTLVLLQNLALSQMYEGFPTGYFSS